MKLFRVLLCLALIPLALAAAELRVATLNCFLLFKPGVSHTGHIANQHPLSNEDYAAKIKNLARAIHNNDIVGVEEIGGRDEMQDLADSAGMKWAYTPGKDTYTGENVGLLYRLDGWKITNAHRVAELQGLSKHLVLTAEKDGHRLEILVVHLIRPMGKRTLKHERQLAAMRAWAKEGTSNRTVVIVGDFNDATRGNLLQFGTDSTSLTGGLATHADGHCYDRIVVNDNLTMRGVEITPLWPTQHPNQQQKRLTSDHMMVSAAVRFP